MSVYNCRNRAADMVFSQPPTASLSSRTGLGHAHVDLDIDGLVFASAKTTAIQFWADGAPGRRKPRS